MKYYSPYQFMPVTNTVNNNPTTLKEYKELVKDTNLVIRHDIWSETALHGRILGKITTKTPSFIGAANIEINRNSRKVEHYEFKGNRAIPGSSIRGLLSSIAETVSQSSLRVLSESSFKGFELNSKPWCNDRNSLTPAELIFGAAETVEVKTSAARNFASRISISDAIISNSNVNFKGRSDNFLKSLWESRPDESYLYYKNKDGPCKQSKAIALPNGRKFFLPWNAEDTHRNIYNTPPNAKRYTQLINGVTPINAEFDFHIDFNNLSDRELELLCTSLLPERLNSNNFHHVIGLGKPHGLGSVSIEISRICYIDRNKRYSTEGAQKKRYSSFWSPCTSGSISCERYHDEAIKTEANKTLNSPFLNFDEDSLIDQETLSWLCVIGDPAKQKSNLKIKYPSRNLDRKSLSSIKTAGLEIPAIKDK